MRILTLSAILSVLILGNAIADETPPTDSAQTVNNSGSGEQLAGVQKSTPDEQPLSLELPENVPDEIDVEKAPPGAQSLLKAIVLQSLPQDYEKSKGWGDQRYRLSGLRIRTDGLKVQTKRKWKKANHGTWKKYRISMVDPKEHLVVRIVNLREAGPGKVAFDLHLGARLKVVGRLQEWNRGIRIVSMSAEAMADVEVDVAMEVATSIKPTKFPPDVVVKPRAQSAEVKMTKFELKRLSHAKGPIVRELGEAVEGVVHRKIKEQNSKLVEKMNKEFVKKQDDLKFSLNDFIKNKWLGLKPKS